ncbi:MAG TPA: PaaX family transcriptional regulator [Oceanithermus profundus]|uniref:PaaX family transcriptional regulator n=1 Tax=Oceanithermus profundus TaxID=187137 RepID=A0A7C4ZI14_9DEIN|nr:PaaX family transcriptional regulator [Oceanithermus profundus]
MRARSTLFTLYTELVYPDDTVWIGQLVHWMERLGFSEPAVRAAVSRSAARGWVIPERKGRRAYYRLSPRVSWQVRQVRRRLYDQGNVEWDGRWRMLAYAVPEALRSRRDKFRNELVLLGYGTPAPGVWVSPSAGMEATRELVRFYELDPYVEFFLAERVSGQPVERLIERVFHLEEAAHHYRALTAQMDRLPRSPSSEEAFVELVRLVHEMRKVLFFDPGLPPELAPEGFCGREVLERFASERRRLRRAAEPLLTPVHALR